MTQTTTYLRYPHLSGNSLVFVADDDVWLADLPGIGATARAWRVTADRVPVRRPRLSPDGTRLAWTSAREGVREAFTLPVDGGATTRLTYWGHARTETIGWASPDEVLVSGWGGHGHRFFTFAHAIPADGGRPRCCPTATSRTWRSPSPVPSAPPLCSAASTPARPTCGSSTAAAPPASCGSTSRATASSSASCRISTATSATRCGTTAASCSSPTTKTSPTSTRRSRTAPTCAATPPARAGTTCGTPPLTASAWSSSAPAGCG
ncbi:hypothetical protein ACFQ9X_09505 [Catenulispora yoronensis]